MQLFTWQYHTVNQDWYDKPNVIAVVASSLEEAYQTVGREEGAHAEQRVRSIPEKFLQVDPVPEVVIYEVHDGGEPK